MNGNASAVVSMEAAALNLVQEPADRDMSVSGAADHHGENLAMPCTRACFGARVQDAGGFLVPGTRQWGKLTSTLLALRDATTSRQVNPQCQDGEKAGGEGDAEARSQRMPAVSGADVKRSTDHSAPHGHPTADTGAGTFENRENDETNGERPGAGQAGIGIGPVRQGQASVSPLSKASEASDLCVCFSEPSQDDSAEDDRIPGDAGLSHAHAHSLIQHMAILAQTFNAKGASPSTSSPACAARADSLCDDTGEETHPAHVAAASPLCLSDSDDNCQDESGDSLRACHDSGEGLRPAFEGDAHARGLPAQRGSSEGGNGAQGEGHERTKSGSSSSEILGMDSGADAVNGFGKAERLAVRRYQVSNHRHSDSQACALTHESSWQASTHSFKHKERGGSILLVNMFV
jgi:hypothetical protein